MAETCGSCRFSENVEVAGAPKGVQSIHPDVIECTGVPETPVGIPQQVHTPKEMLLKNPGMPPVMTQIMFQMVRPRLPVSRRACALWAPKPHAANQSPVFNLPGAA